MVAAVQRKQGRNSKKEGEESVFESKGNSFFGYVQKFLWKQYKLNIAVQYVFAAIGTERAGGP